MPDKEKSRKNFMLILSAAIIRYRYIIFLLFIVFGVYCGVNFGRGGNNADLTAFLSPTTETKQGLAIMEEEFIEYATADVMISNITYERAEELSGEISAFSNVSSVEFDRSRSHYANAAALFQVTFDAVQDDPVTEAALETLWERLSAYDLYIHTQIGYDFAGQIAREMGGVLGIAAVVIAVILLFTSRSYFEVVIFFIVFFFAALFNMGVEQLRGEHWNRLVFTVELPTESPEALALVEQIRAIAEAEYGKGQVLLVGDITSARDLSASFESDSLLISLLTIGFVLAILLVTFRTVAGSLLLVFVIQGSIWINFSFPYLMGQSPSFVTYMIVSAIQMGATIDYAIVLMNRYLCMRQTHEKKEAMIEAVNQSFPTILTSGSNLTLAGLIISWRVTDVYVGHIGLAVGRGALTSGILVLTVLPQLLVLCDRLIFKTRFHIDLTGGEDA